MRIVITKFLIFFVTLPLKLKLRKKPEVTIISTLHFLFSFESWPMNAIGLVEHFWTFFVKHAYFRKVSIDVYGRLSITFNSQGNILVIFFNLSIFKKMFDLLSNGITNFIKVNNAETCFLIATRIAHQISQWFHWFYICLLPWLSLVAINWNL